MNATLRMFRVKGLGDLGFREFRVCKSFVRIQGLGSEERLFKGESSG